MNTCNFIETCFLNVCALHFIFWTNAKLISTE